MQRLRSKLQEYLSLNMQEDKLVKPYLLQWLFTFHHQPMAPLQSLVEITVAAQRLSNYQTTQDL